jgi:hypothetical protein
VVGGWGVRVGSGGGGEGGRMTLMLNAVREELYGLERENSPVMRTDLSAYEAWDQLLDR